MQRVQGSTGPPAAAAGHSLACSMERIILHVWYRSFDMFREQCQTFAWAGLGGAFAPDEAGLHGSAMSPLASSTACISPQAHRRYVSVMFPPLQVAMLQLSQSRMPYCSCPQTVPSSLPTWRWVAHSIACTPATDCCWRWQRLSALAWST